MSRGENIADEIKSRCNIIDVVGRLVTLKKTGSNYKGLCPFHNEKTPSFVVSEDKQRFTCYGCGASGDVIEFVQRYHRLSFLEAAEKLAEEYGIEWSRSTFDTEGRRSALYEINREAARFFYRALRRSENPALSYMAGRKIDAATLKTFGIGYADDSWDSLYRYLKQQDIDEKELLELGLIAAGNGKRYDKFRNRVMFPILNTREKVIGFGGRILGDGAPKYLNSPESRVFQKKNNLYALNITRQEISAADQAILVEGYMDVISLYRYGIKNVTASLGTALTAGQAAMLKRYTENIVIAYDADKAGKNATLRGMEVLREAGCRVKVLQVEGAKDPDEYVRKNGRSAFQSLADQAMPYAEYRLKVLKERYRLMDPEESITFLKEAAGILKTLSPVEADFYIRKLAEESGISEGAIRMETLAEDAGASVQIPDLPAAGSRSEKAGTAQAGGGSMLEKNFIRLLLLKRDYLKRIEPYAHIFRTPALYRIYESIAALYREDAEIDLQKLEDSLDAPERAVLADVQKNIRLGNRDEQVFAECVSRIEAAGLIKRQKEILRMLQAEEKEENQEKIEDLTKEFQKIQQAMTELKGR